MMKCIPHLFLTGSTGSYAFTVAPTATETYDDGDKVLFDRVITNIGGGWNPTLNEFVCQVNGLYMFMLTINTPSTDEAGVDIMMDNNNMVRVRADGTLGIITSSSQVVIHECELAARVWVQTTRDSVIQSGSNALTTFSGMLITAYE